MSAQHLGTGGGIDAAFDLRGRSFIDQGSQIHLRIERITYLQSLRGLHQALHERIGDLPMYQQSLDRGTALPAVAIGTGHRQRYRFIEIGIFHHDHGVVAPSSSTCRL